MIGIVGIMVTTACAAELGVFTRLAAWIEPRTRGPVRSRSASCSWSPR